MRILITGGAGCLGSNLLEHLLPKGHDILAIDNFATGYREVLPDAPGLKSKEGSVADAEFVKSCFEEFEPTHVIHAAAAYKNPSDWNEEIRTNICGTINVAHSAIEAKVKRFINFQTALCYGRPEILPIPVDAPTRPFTSYGISKTAGEKYLTMMDLPYVSLRLANITGPRLSIGPIPTFYRRLKDGDPCFCSETVRDFMDMSDFFSLMDLVLVAGGPTGIYNVSTGKGNTIAEILNIIVDYLGVTLEAPIEIVPAGEDDVFAVVLDPSETERIFGWKAKTEFKETIHKMLRWYDSNGVNAIYSHLAIPAK